MFAVSATPTEYQSLEVCGEVRWIKGTVDDGYTSFAFDPSFYSLAKGAKYRRLKMREYGEYFRDQYGLTLALDPPYEKELHFVGEHLGAVLAALELLLSKNVHVIARFSKHT